MKIATGKKLAADAGLELYYDRQWQSWGLVDPALNVESLWLSSGQLDSLSDQDFGIHYIAVMQNRINPDAGGDFPISEPVEMKTVRNLMSGIEISIPANTPFCCDPSTEIYWSM